MGDTDCLDAVDEGEEEIDDGAIDEGEAAKDKDGGDMSAFRALGAVGCLSGANCSSIC